MSSDREIKFRAQTLSGEWIYTSPTTMFSFSGDFAYLPGRGEGSTIIPLKKGTRGQYTGVKDMNGVEVYEGDLLSNGLLFCGRVFYEDSGFVCENILGTYLDRSANGRASNWDNLKVFGNTYDNPERLEAKS